MGNQAKVLLIYGDPNHHQGLIYQSSLERNGLKVVLDQTLGAYRDPGMLHRLLQRHNPDIIVAGSHLRLRFDF